MEDQVQGYAEEGSGQILSSDEVGALFEAVKDAGASAGDDAMAADFAAAGERLERPFEPPPVDAGGAEVRRLIARVHGVFAIEAGATIGALLRLPVQFEIGTPGEADRETTLVGDETRIGLGLVQKAQFAAFYFDATLVRALADRTLGGPGIPSAPGRPLSELEKRVSLRGLQLLAAALASAWRPWLEGDPAATVAIEESDRPLAGPLTAVRMRVRLGELDIAGLGLYATAPLALASGITQRPPAAAAAASGRGLGERLANLPMRVSFEAPGFTLTVAELLRLSPGVSLALARCDELKVEAQVEGTPRFRGRLVLDASGTRTVAIDETIPLPAR